MYRTLQKSILFVLMAAVFFSFTFVISDAATESKTVKLKSKVTSVKVTMTAGDKLKLAVKVGAKKLAPSKVKFKSSKKTVAAVTRKGVVTAKNAGKATITIKAKKKTAKLKVNVKEQPAPVPEGELITLPFMSTWNWNDPKKANVTTMWNVQDLDWSQSNSEPNQNLTVAALLLATNIETHDRDVDPNQWDQIIRSLAALGFTENPYHAYFDGDYPGQTTNYPAMAFATHKEKVNGKTVVAVVFRGSSSIQDFITDAKSQLDKLLPGIGHSSVGDETVGGFYQVGVNATNELKKYLDKNNLKKEDTTLFITGHSLGAATASLVGLMSAYNDLAEKNSIFCYPFATPNSLKADNSGNIMTGKDMKMFSFDNEEDIVPDVPVGLSYYKTGKDITFDREWMKAEEPEQYALFNELYTYFRGRSYENDNSYFMPREYAFQFFSDHDINVDSIMVRNHMPYTYMALILSQLPPDVARTYIQQ